MTTGSAGAPAGGNAAVASGGSGGAAIGGSSGSGSATAIGGAGVGGSSSSAGSASMDCKAPSASGSLFTRLPCALSETGLYAADMVTLQPGVHPFKPNFALWSDGADKKRWVSLPQGSKIDTSDIDYWSFPTGTKLWKEFSRDGVRVETRLIAKQASGTWYAVAYHWRADQKDADAVPNGVMNASGTPHDIPNNDQCLTCHSQLPDKALGFSAIQLSHDRSDPSNTLEWTLDALVEENLLTNPPVAPFTVPGTDAQRDLFGYLHANCGTCHNPKGTQNTQTGLDMWLKVADMSKPITESSVYKGLYNVDIAWMDAAIPLATKRIAPGSLMNSAVYQRFITKGQDWSMPPLATEIVDPAGKKLLEDWISGS